MICVVIVWLWQGSGTLLGPESALPGHKGYDAVVMHTLISHTSDPAAVVKSECTSFRGTSYYLRSISRVPIKLSLSVNVLLVTVQNNV